MARMQGRPGSVLFADDDQHFRLAVGEMLSITGREIIVARDGDEAWALLVAHHPALAILDGQMPGRSGWELTQAIRASADLADTRVIMLTGDVQGRRAGLEGGVDAYLVKPFTTRELLDTVDRLLAE
jgi:DNA-binding response OmpR family regulator